MAQEKVTVTEAGALRVAKVCVNPFKVLSVSLSRCHLQIHSLVVYKF